MRKSYVELRRSGGYDNSIIHRSGISEFLQNVGHSRLFLSNGYVNTDDVATLLIDDGVDGNGCLAGLAVTEDQFPLAPADGNHGVDGLDPGLQWLVY